MLTEYEAQKLIHDMRDELDVTPGVAFRYMAALLIFLGLAVAVVLTDLQLDAAGDAAAAAQRAAKPHHDRASTAETRKVLEERRKRFESRPPVQAVRSSEAAEIEGAPEVDKFTLMTRASD